MHDVPFCPGCGKNMDCEVMKLTFHEPYTYEAEWKCKCGWKSPRGTGHTREEAVQNAAEASKRRLLQKPIELEALKSFEDGTEVFFESRIKAPYCSGYAAVHHAEHCEEIYYCGDDDGYIFEHREYAQTWRCWQQRPTNEERDAAVWKGLDW